MPGRRLVAALAAAAAFVIPTQAANIAFAEPCAQLARAQALYFKQNTQATTAIVNADLVYKCFKTVPNYKDPAVALVNGLKAWWQIHSEVDYIKTPTAGYLWDGVDMLGSLDTILQHLEAKAYDSEYDFQLDLFANTFYARNFHFIMEGDLIQTASFYRPYRLVSFSRDGKELPRVYLASDIITNNNHFDIALLSNARASAISAINGWDVQHFLQTQSWVAQSHDPDAMYNQLFLTPALTQNPAGVVRGPYEYPQFYPGSMTNITFENGTTYNFTNLAKLNFDFRNVTSGVDVYEQFCVEANPAPENPPNGTSLTSVPAVPSSSTVPATSSASATASSTVSAATSATTTPTIDRLPSYPKPVVIDESGILSGYYLPGDNFDDVAVLAIRGFQGLPVDTWLETFQSYLQDFLSTAVNDGKKKLVLDLQGNGGGFLDAGTELVAQLFPHDEPNTASSMRESLGLSRVMTKLGLGVQQVKDAEKKVGQPDQQLEDVLVAPYAWQSVMRPNVEAFTNDSDFQTSSYIYQEGNFTQFFQNNWTNTDPSQMYAGRIEITGTNNRTGFKQPFQKENIIIFTDGYCGSTCSVVTEALKNLHGIKFITIGGRPQQGPMQAIGNSKGSQVWDWNQDLSNQINFWMDQTTFPINRTDFDPESPFYGDNWSMYPLLRGFLRLNGRNAYRINDTTNTPKQMVYEAADCRIWYTPEMLADANFLWSRVADIAFNSYNVTKNASSIFSSQYCVAGSTGHPTSISGGLKYGDIGPQTPPPNAKPAYPFGWLRNGTKLATTWSPNDMNGASSNGNASSVVGTVDGVASNQDPKSFFLLKSLTSNSTSAGLSDSDVGGVDDDDDDDENGNVSGGLQADENVAEGLHLKSAETQQGISINLDDHPITKLRGSCSTHNADEHGWLMTLICEHFGLPVKDDDLKI